MTRPNDSPSNRTSTLTFNKFLALAIFFLSLMLGWLGAKVYFSGETAASCGQSVEHWVGAEPPEHHIVYLIGNEGLETNLFMKPSYLEENLQVWTVRCWSDLHALNQAVGLDGLIVHRSALPLIDRHWLRNAYRRGLVVVGFNIYASEMGTLLEDTRLSEDGIEAPFPHPFFLSTYQFIQGSPEDKAQSASGATLQGTWGRVNEQLVTEEHFAILKQSLIHQIDAIHRIQKQE